MLRRFSLIVVTFVSAAVAAVAGIVPGQASRTPSCAASARSHAALASDARGQFAAAFGETVRLVGSGGSRSSTVAGAAARGVPRHVAFRAGLGLAFVDDLRGADDVVIGSAGGVLRLHQPSEATNPSLSPTGDVVWSLGAELRLWSRTTSGITRIPAPQGTGQVFSSAFHGRRAIVAVVSEHVPESTTQEDDSLNNLWRYDLRAGRWTRLTRFTAGRDRWSVIRTPLVAQDGSIEFVRVHGRGSPGSLAAFELWRLRGGHAQKVRSLPKEMYLAATQGGRRIWNVYDAAGGDWRLVREDSAGRLVDLGCGRVMVDPRAELDPDRTPPPGELGSPPSPTSTPIPNPTPTPTPTTPPTPTMTPTVTPSPTSSATPTPTVTTSPQPTGPTMAVLVGDFGAREAAEEVAARVLDAYGSASAEVIDADGYPTVVQPGVWAVVLRLPADADLAARLEEFRGRFPDIAGWTWLVTV
jgi:hypothetical protein